MGQTTDGSWSWTMELTRPERRMTMDQMQMDQFQMQILFLLLSFPGVIHTVWICSYRCVDTEMCMDMNTHTHTHTRRNHTLTSS